MDNVLFFINISSLILGACAIYLVIRLYQSHRYRYLLFLLFNLALFNVISILYLPSFYLFEILETSLELTQNHITIIIFLTVINLIKFLWSYSFILFVYELLGKKISKIFQFAILLTCAAFLIAFIVTALGGHGAENAQLIQYYDDLITYQSTITALVVFIYFFISRTKLEDNNKIKAVNLYTIPLLVIWSFSALINFIGAFIDLGMNQNLIISVVIFSCNAVPLIVIRSFVKYFGSTESEAPEIIKDLTELYTKYNISKREQEITDLICMGKSNKQIAEELFISLYTVKDHIHNIFQKTSVKNRVQLTNLFRQAE